MILVLASKASKQADSQRCLIENLYFYVAYMYIYVSCSRNPINFVEATYSCTEKASVEHEALKICFEQLIDTC